MPTNRLEGVRLAGVAAAVPTRSAGLTELETAFPDFDVAKSARTIGVATRRIASATTTTADLCEAAAKRLLADCALAPEDIDLVLFISQTPDHILPPTSCILHGRLKLATTCAAFDVNLGCSGYPYGLWMAGNLMRGSGFRRALLLAGDTISKLCNPHDKSVVPVFGDAGSATILEVAEGAPPMVFSLGTDGAGVSNLIVPAGGFRERCSPESAETRPGADGNLRSDDDLYMNGSEIFTFTLREIPPLMDRIREASGWADEEIDHFVFHQANEFMLEHLRKRLKVPAEKFVKALSPFGNTSSASIPLAIVYALQDELRSRARNLILAGFGVGYSWGAAAVTVGPIVVSDLVEVDG